MIVIAAEQVLELLNLAEPNGQATISFSSVDHGDVYLSTVLLGKERLLANQVTGTLSFLLPTDTQPDREKWSDEVVVFARLPFGFQRGQLASAQNLSYTGFVRTGDQVIDHHIQVVPVREELFSRVRGIYETDVLADKRVLIVGLGSGGGSIAVDLAKAGVGHFTLIDHDRIELANVVRHVCGISDLGRFKTRAVRDLLLDKNPFADIETLEVECQESMLDQLRERVRDSDLVFCCTDNRPSRTLVNRACVQEHRTCIYGGTFTRAYGGHVLRVIPGDTMCYQCFIDMLPEVVEDQEIASPAQAENWAYADRPVAIEPGLASDIAPISIMCVKLGVLELLRGETTTLSNLYDDLANPWFQWLNRRETGTEYEELRPIDSGDDDLRILAWYGISTERNPACPTCGDFVAVKLAEAHLELTPDQIAAFRPKD